MLTSVEAWPRPLVRSPAGAPFSVIVCAVPTPTAPGWVGGQSWVVGKLASTGESAGVQGFPLLRPPWQTFEPAQEPPAPPGQSASVLHGPVAFVPALQVLLQTGHDWMPGAFGKRSPPRNSSELSGRLRLEAPVEQFAVPVPS